MSLSLRDDRLVHAFAVARRTILKFFHLADMLVAGSRTSAIAGAVTYDTKGRRNRGSRGSVGVTPRAPVVRWWCQDFENCVARADATRHGGVIEVQVSTCAARCTRSHGMAARSGDSQFYAEPYELAR
jgi:hypothetical protein